MAEHVVRGFPHPCPECGGAVREVVTRREPGDLESVEEGSVLECRGCGREWDPDEFPREA